MREERLIDWITMIDPFMYFIFIAPIAYFGFQGQIILGELIERLPQGSESVGC